MLSLSTGESTPLNDVYTSLGTASFFSFKGTVYLLDGYGLFSMVGDQFLPAEGYLPLYGKEWHPIRGGDIYEPLNIISPKMRISFKIPSTVTSSFDLPLVATKLLYVTRNGEEEKLSDYAINSDGRSVFNHTNPTYYVDDVIEFFLEISDEYIDRSIIGSCRSAAVYGDGSAGADKIFVAFYNGKDKNIIYPSINVPNDQLGICRKANENIMGIYVTPECALSANDGNGNIVDVCQKDMGLMVFTDDRAFMLTTDESGENHFVRVSLGTGCSSPSGAIISDDTPITVSHYGIFKWDPSSYEEGEYRARCISRPVQELIGDEFSSNAVAYHYKKKDELWFCSPSSSDGMVLVYSIDSEAWYRFSGIGAEFFFEYNGEVGYIKGNKAYIFSQDKETDTVGGEERPVCARFESGILSFGGFWKKKRLSRCIIRTSPGATVSLTVTDAEGRIEKFTLTDGSGESIGFIDKRLALRRSRHYSISVETEKNSVIYGVTLTAAD